MLFPTFWAFGWRCSSNINELIAMCVKIWPTFWHRDLLIWPLTLKHYKLLHWVKIHLWVQNGEDMSKRSWFMRENVLISFKHEYRRLILSSSCDVTGDVISMKIIFPGLFAYDRSRSDVRLRLPLEILKILKFSKVTKFWGPGELFRRECHRKLAMLNW